MIAVIFEVEPHPDLKGQYLDIAAALRPELEASEGFISVERFQSLNDDGKILSLSFFRDEQAVALWRNRQAHRKAQQKGREQVFRTYRIRVAQVLRDYTLDDRNAAPAP